MTIIIQSPLIVGRVLSTLEEAADPSVTEVRLAIAYVTLSGVKKFADSMACRVGDPWHGVPKQLITCIDFGFTDPEALRAWLKLGNASVLLHNTHIKDTRLRPQKAFHAKYYEFRSPAGTSIVVGSANLSRAALTSNFEAVMQTAVTGDLASAESAWDALTAGAEPANEATISEYANRRAAIKISIANAIYTKPLPGPRLWDAIQSGGAEPQNFDHFWVDAGSMTSGGSSNQLELPRGGHQFFGGTVNYNKRSKKIVDVKICTLSTAVDRPISWHGSNRMERLNLPTNAKYAGRVVLFRRRTNGFALLISNYDSLDAQSWIDRSVAFGQYFKVGGNSPRRCGFF